jgi:hypothetical protein
LLYFPFYIIHIKAIIGNTKIKKYEDI